MILPPDTDRISFEVAFDDYARYDPPRFQAKLSGIDQDFSEPRVEPVFNYRKLGHGRYRFEVRARDAAGRIYALNPVELVVEPRWHEQPWVRMIFGAAIFLGLVVLVVLVARWRTRRLNALVKQRTLELEAANTKLAELASRDGLTGVANRRHFDQTLLAMAESCAREARTLALLMADVDHFKTYNDAHGHLAGDDLLRLVGTIFTSEAEARGGYAARYGGEEFAVLFPGVTQEEALAAAERIRAAVATLGRGVTISIGLAHGEVHPEATKRLVAAADAALYLAKNAGRNRIEVAAHAAREFEQR